jgi:hypothetical protein
VAAGMGHKYFVRTFMEGDEIAIVQLFEKAYRNYGGYTRKTPEGWRWCCLQRPDVNNESIFIVSDQNSKAILGYVVVGKSGALWELCYEQNSDGKEVVSLLLDQATAYLENAAASSINFTAPTSDPIIKQACKERGFAAGPPPKMFLSVLNLQRLMSLLVGTKATELKTKFDEAILIKIKDAPFWINDSVFLRINREGATVEDENRKSTMQLQIDYVTFSSVLFGNISPFSAFIRSKLTIKPSSKILTGLKLLSQLQIGAEWSFPLSEYG